MAVFSYPKGSKSQVSANFHAHEFDCPCAHPECQTTLIDEDLPVMLEKMRANLACPLIIDSGFRCQAHQADLMAQGFETSKGISQHSLGKAADVRTGHDSGGQLEAAAREAGFLSIGVGKTWIHVDLRSIDQRWFYLRRN